MADATAVDFQKFTKIVLKYLYLCSKFLKNRNKHLLPMLQVEAARIPSCVVPFNTQCKYCSPSRQLTSLAL